LYVDQPLIAYLLIESGMALPPERIDRDLSVVGNLRERNAFFAGAYAADQGRWPAYDTAVHLLQAAADRHKASGDSLDSDWNESAAKVLQAYGRWKRGHGAEALPILRSLQRPSGATSYLISSWLGELSLELGKQREAAAYFSSIWGDDATLVPLAAFHLGEIYADLGEFEKARESYEYALLAWQDADPEMQPRIEVARQALARLPNPLRRDSQ
jgi:tetratricopeptide (TPR) repeat protein